MIINLKTQKDGVWFPFFYSKIDPSNLEITYGDPIEGGPRMKIRNPIALFKERTEKRKTETQFVLNKKTRAMDKVVSEVELTAKQKKEENEDFVDFVIQEVEGFKLDGKIIKGTREEKTGMMELPVISMFVARCIELLQESGTEEEAVETKNSLTGSSSRTIKPDPG